MSAPYAWNDLIDDIIDWQEATFPNTNGIHGPIAHLYKEAVELRRFAEIHNTVDAEELADIFFMLLQTASRAEIDLFRAISGKLGKNRQRKWNAPDADGVVEHVRGLHD